MKYIKKFENTTKYQKGEYVILKHKPYNNGEILMFEIIVSKHHMYVLQNPLDIISNDNGWYIEDDILRKATNEEFENLKLKLTMKKYNL